MKNKVGRPKQKNHICGNTLYYHRLAHGMSQGEMAKKIGLSIRTISRIESEPNFKTTRVTSYKVAYEIIFNPVPDHPEVLELIDKWNEERNMRERNIGERNKIIYSYELDMKLSIRALNCLQNGRIESVGDLVQKRERDLIRIKNLGRSTLREIKAALWLEYGLTLRGDKNGR